MFSVVFGIRERGFVALVVFWEFELLPTFWIIHGLLLELGLAVLHRSSGETLMMAVFSSDQALTFPLSPCRVCCSQSP